MMTWCLEGGGLVAQIYPPDAASKALGSLRIIFMLQGLVLLWHQAPKIGIFAAFGCLMTLMALASSTQILIALTTDLLCCFILLALYHLRDTPKRHCVIQPGPS